MQARTRILAAISTALLLTSCSQEAPSDQPVAVQTDAVKVSLLDAGDGNKQALRFKPTTTPQQTTLLIDDGFHQTTSTGDDTPEETHTMKLPVTAEASAGNDADGDSGDSETADDTAANRSVKVTVGTPTYSDTTLNKELATAKGFAVSWAGDDTGRINSLTFSAPDNATDTARAATERFLQHVINLPIVFPSDDVGKDAKWKVESRVSGASTLLQTTTYTAKSITHDAVELDVQVEQRPAVSKLSITGPDGQPTGDLQVLNSTTNSKGTIWVDLNKPLPEGDIQFTTTVHYGGDSDVTVTQMATTRIQFQ